MSKASKPKVQIPVQPPTPPPPPPKTTAQIAKQLADIAENQIYAAFNNDSVTINPNKKIMSKPKKQYHNQQGQPYAIQDFEHDLSSLRASIVEQKKAQKQQEKVKLEMAHRLIQKMKREKAQHEEKIRLRGQKSFVTNRIYSETHLHNMRMLLDERIQKKRQQIQQRINKMEQKSYERKSNLMGKQIQNWEKIKTLSERAKSTDKLIEITNPEQKFKLASSIPRKGSLQNLKKLSLVGAADKNMQKYMQMAQIKQDNLKIKMVQFQNEHRLSKIINSNRQLAEKLSGNTHQETTKVVPYQINRFKVMGNQYLKESLMRVKKTDISSQDIQSSGKLNLSVEGQEAHINQNGKVEKLREKWNRVLSKLEHKQIQRDQGLQLLHDIQRRLDKIDLIGVTGRLKKKFQVLQKVTQLKSLNSGSEKLSS